MPCFLLEKEVLFGVAKTVRKSACPEHILVNYLYLFQYTRFISNEIQPKNLWNRLFTMGGNRIGEKT